MRRAPVGARHRRRGRERATVGKNRSCRGRVRLVARAHGARPKEATSTAPGYPLAFDAAGNPITVPPEAVGWRVRRGGGVPGRPRNVYDAATGRPLNISLDATVHDLIARGCPPDQYRLEAIDANGQIIPDVVAIVEIPGGGGDEDDGGPLMPTEPVTAALTQTLQLLGRTIEANCRTMMAMASAFGSVRPTAPVVAAPEPSKPPIDPTAAMTWIDGIVSKAMQAFAEGKASVGNKS